MKKIILSLTFGVALIIGSNDAFAIFTYSTDFTTDSAGGSYQPNQFLPGYGTGSLTNQGGWTQFIDGSTDINAAVIYPIGGTSTNNYLYLGGGNSPTPSDYYVASRDFGVLSNSVYYDTVFSLNSGTTGQDVFGWTINNAAGVALLNINLVPTSQTNGYSLYGFQLVSWDNANGGNGVTNTISTVNNFSLIGSGTNAYHLGFDIENIGQANQLLGLYSYSANGSTNATLVSVGNVFTNNDYTGIDTNIGSLGVTWIPTDMNNPGNNFMASQTFEITSTPVPEPNGLRLCGIAAVGIFLHGCRRRKV